MKLVDVHAHLDHSRFEDDLAEVIERARKKEMVVVTSGVNSITNKIALEIAEKNPDVVKVSFGLYPLDSLEKEIEEVEKMNSEKVFSRDIKPFNLEEELKFLKKNKEKFIGVGEIGLDYNWPEFQTEKIKDEQRKTFEKILGVAKELDKPVIIHSRKAEKEAIEILEKMKMKKVVMHCFCGKKSLVKRCVENGWYFSVPPAIKRWDNFKLLVELVPLKQLLTETDSPYLASVARERNEPANVAITIEEIARIKKLGEEEVADQIFKNAVELFGL